MLGAPMSRLFCETWELSPRRTSPSRSHRLKALPRNKKGRDTKSRPLNPTHLYGTYAYTVFSHFVPAVFTM
jgi:hypothetical protein